MNLQDLVKIPDNQRDQAWENKFFNELSTSNVKLASPDPQQGPDGWPYMMAMTNDAGTGTGTLQTEPFQKLMQWCATKGIGLVVNPQKKDYPDYVFTYGMLWHFKESGLFFKPMEDRPTGNFELKAGAGLHSGPPSPEYLPVYVKNILREFFRDQGVLRPKILVLSADRKHYDLAISLDSLGDPDESEHAGIAEAVSWFLPPHYSIILVSEEGLPDFVDL